MKDDFWKTILVAAAAGMLLANITIMNTRLSGIRSELFMIRLELKK